MHVFYEILRAVIFIVVAYMVVFVAALFNIVWERRFLAFMQDRLGPNRTGPQGVLQSVADAFKMMGKEDFAPARVDKILFTLAPIMVMVPAVAIQMVIPYTMGRNGTSQDLNIGLIYIVAITSFTVFAILLGGWASYNKYSLVGALRAAAQMISYEVPMLLGILAVAMASGSLSLSALVEFQKDYHWLIFYMPFTFFIFYIASIAELNRGPFDLPEAESELVAGYNTEYSGMRFGMFFLNEYAGLTIMSMISVTLFFGGWRGPFANELSIHGVALVGIAWFLVKTHIMVSLLIWIRLSFPRLQVDQLMGFAWKVLIPLGLFNIAVSAAIILWAPHWKYVMAVYSWAALIAFVSSFDKILDRRLSRVRASLAVLD